MKNRSKRTATRYSLWIPVEVLEAYRAMARAKAVTVSSLIVAAARRSVNRKKGKK